MFIPSQVLLSTCVFLFLTPGDGRLCIKCIVATPGVPCNHELCEVDDEGICLGILTYRNGEFIEKLLGCAKKDVLPCDVPSRERKGLLQEFKCCDNIDFCNASF